MASFNKIVMIGNVTSDPVLKAVGENSVCNFSLAVNRKTKNKDETCFIEVNVWNKQAELVKQYVAKGDPILVEGALKQDNWVDKDSGAKRSKHCIVADHVVFLKPKSGGGEAWPKDADPELIKSSDALAKAAAEVQAMFSDDLPS